jgi:hypothetical protein
VVSLSLSLLKTDAMASRLLAASLRSAARATSGSPLCFYIDTQILPCYVFCFLFSPRFLFFSETIGPSGFSKLGARWKYCFASHWFFQGR